MKIKSRKAILYLSLLIFFLVTLHASAAFSTMYDVNKYWNDNIPVGVDPDDTSDSLMCWAAASSNVLRATGWGVDTDGDGTVHHQLDMYHEFLLNFPNDGGSGSLAYESYFAWHYPETIISDPDTNSLTGNLFEQVYHHWLEPEYIINQLDQLLEDYYGVYLSITETGWGGHAITVWDHFILSHENQNLHFLTVTDSDDGTIEEAKTYPILMDNDRWYLNNYYGKNTYYMRRLDALAPRYRVWDPDLSPLFDPPQIILNPDPQFMQPVYNLHYQLQLQDTPDGPGSPVPEPTTMLLLGAGLLGFAGLGRKRFFNTDFRGTFPYNSQSPAPTGMIP